MHAVPIDLDGNHKLTHTGRTAIVSQLPHETILCPGQTDKIIPWYKHTQTNTDKHRRTDTETDIMQYYRETHCHKYVDRLYGPT